MLVAAPDRWDETCFAVPAVRALMASGLRVGVLCFAEEADFWSTLDGLQVVAFPRKTKPKHAARGIRGRWQASLVWQEGFAADTMFIAGVPRRLGSSLGRLPRRLTHPLATVANPLDHRVRFYLSLVEEMGVDTRRPDFFAPATLGIEPVADTVMLVPDSDFGPSHEWPLDRWEGIARSFLDVGKRPTIAGLPGGRALGRGLADRLNSAVVFFEASPLCGVLPLLAAHAKVVAADGSLPHLAGHAGTTCVTLFGPGDPDWRRPLGRRHSVVRRHVECAPCLLAKCPLDLRCQTELDVARVWAVANTVGSN